MNPGQEVPKRAPPYPNYGGAQPGSLCQKGGKTKSKSGKEQPRRRRQGERGRKQRGLTQLNPNQPKPARSQHKKQKQKRTNQQQKQISMACMDYRRPPDHSCLMELGKGKAVEVVVCGQGQQAQSKPTPTHTHTHTHHKYRRSWIGGVTSKTLLVLLFELTSKHIDFTSTSLRFPFDFT